MQSNKVIWGDFIPTKVPPASLASKPSLDEDDLYLLAEAITSAKADLLKACESLEGLSDLTGISTRWGVYMLTDMVDSLESHIKESLNKSLNRQSVTGDPKGQP